MHRSVKMNNKITSLLYELHEGSFKAISRGITLVENDLEGSNTLLTSLKINKQIPVIGITGPPGAGKSSLVNALLHDLAIQNKKIGVLAVDPTSPFNLGAILGDRIRMSEHFGNPHIFIRSLASRGSLGGLSAKIIEVTDILRASCFDYIIIETVGVGQSEIEIVGLADVTVLVLVPEAGDEIQQLKSGVMEIADIFVVNKADRPGADTYLRNLSTLLRHPIKNGRTPHVVKTIATRKEGITELLTACNDQLKLKQNTLKDYLLLEKAYKLIQNEVMKKIDKSTLKAALLDASEDTDFNLYRFISHFLKKI